MPVYQLGYPSLTLTGEILMQAGLPGVYIYIYTWNLIYDNIYILHKFDIDYIWFIIS